MRMKMEQIECSKTSAYKILTPGITQMKAYNNAKFVLQFLAFFVYEYLFRLFFNVLI